MSEPFGDMPFHLLDKTDVAIMRANDIRRLCFARDLRDQAKAVYDAAEYEYQALLRALTP